MTDHPAVICGAKETRADGMSERHGTAGGYRDDRCRCEPCKRAIAKEHNVYKMRRAANGGGHLTVPKRGSVRRLQALMALGWTRRELARQAGYQGDAFALILNSDRASVTLATARRIDDLFDRLSMTHGPSDRTRAIAAKAGWPPPLAWDDIDNNEHPTGLPNAIRREAAEFTVEDWELLQRNGYTRRAAAEYMGITKKRLEKAIERHTRRMQEAS